jgi:adenosine deaminase
MEVSSIDPLVDVQIDPSLLALPKADLHLHQEETARLDRIVARQRGSPPYDWRQWAQRLMADTPPGPRRLARIYAPDAALALDGVPSDAPEYIIAKVADVLEEGAAEGAVLMEVRFGAAGQALMQPDFMALFREAERRVQRRYPQLRAEALGLLSLVHDSAHLLRTEQQVATCMQMAREGLAGVDFLVNPYHTEADPALWEITYRYAERAVDAGLGITVHAGEFSTANLAAALRVPGLRRIGHAVYAAHDPRLLEQVAQSGVTVECCLTCNVLLGAVPSYEAHPIRRFVACGIPVTLNTDDPVRVCTTIGREYAVAAALGFSPADLLTFTRAAVDASFAAVERRAALLHELDRWG